MSVPSANLAERAPQDPEVERLVQSFVNLTPHQLQWVSGYAAGLAAVSNATNPTLAPEVESANALTILYGSQTGNGEDIAKQLEMSARKNGFAVKLTSLADYKPANLKREKLAVFVISTHGEGDPPDDAELFHEFLLSGKAPNLSDLTFSVLALGDSSYVNYCQTGREFDRRLADLGATRLVPLVECDLAYDEVAAQWAANVLQKLPEIVDSGTALPKLHAVSRTAAYGKHRPFDAEVLVNQKITAGSSSKDVRHLELSLEGSGLHYEPGDSLAVIAKNPLQLVEQFLDTLKLEGAALVQLKDDQVSLKQALQDMLEITAINLNFLKNWAEVCQIQALRDVLDNRTELAALIESHQIIDVLRRFPAKTDAQTLVDSLRVLTPRSYSIASSARANPDEVHLTVAPVRYMAFDSEHWGVASTHLADRVAEGDSVQVYVESNSRFRLPENDATDVIMIGPGTGVAPFRAFVEERGERNAAGKNWLFFGDRNFSSDFLYQLEWLRHLKNGRLDRLDVAFSRDQKEKIYVQERIKEHGAELFRWLEGGAHIYVCGDAKRMAPDVEAALIDVIAEHANESLGVASAKLKQLRRAGRYQRDVY